MVQTNSFSLLLLIVVVVGVDGVSATACETDDVFNDLSNTIVNHGHHQLLAYNVTNEIIVEPYMAFNMASLPEVRPSPFDSGFYARVPILIRSSVSNGYEVLQVKSFSVELRNGFRPCLKCPELQVGSLWTETDGPSVVLTSVDVDVVRKALTALHFETPDSDVVRKAFNLKFKTSAKHRRFLLVKEGLPVRRLSGLNNAFWFEPGRLLLFTIQSKIGKDAFSSFMTPGHNEIPQDGQLPSLYRSGMLDAMTKLARRTNMKYLIVEMRRDGRMVAQAKFDIARNADSLSLSNWFTANRLVSTQPYQLPTASFGYFSIVGHASFLRRFFINYSYSRCNGDKGFMAVLDARDGCQWGHKFWNGRAPVLIYTVSQTGNWANSVAEADRFLIYLE